MDIVSRIKKFLDENGIPNSQFADNCKIPRPTISQVLNGRNKKISDEVIAKIHHAYPALSITWLLFGEGEMINGSSPVQPSEHHDESEDECMDSIDEPSQDFTDTSDQTKIYDAIRPAIQASADTNKRITNIVVFYNDNSFQSFFPSQN